MRLVGGGVKKIRDVFLYENQKSHQIRITLTDETMAVNFKFLRDQKIWIRNAVINDYRPREGAEIERHLIAVSSTTIQQTEW